MGNALRMSKTAILLDFQSSVLVGLRRRPRVLVLFVASTYASRCGHVVTSRYAPTGPDMIAAASPAADLNKDYSSAVVALSENLKLSAHVVQEIYSQEFDRLAMKARVQSFVGVLAMRNTRAILREGYGRPTHA